MARLDLTPYVPLGAFVATPIGANAADVPYVAQSTPGDGWAITANNGRLMLLVHNTDVGAQTVTVISVDRAGRTGNITTYSIGTLETACLGPFDRDGWNQTDGRVHIDASDANVEAAVLQLGASLFPNS